MFTAQGPRCVRLRFSVNIPGMHVYVWCMLLGGATWNAAGEKTLCARVCVCPVQVDVFWVRLFVRAETRSRGSNLKLYDVIDNLIFWEPARRPLPSVMDANTHVHPHTLWSIQPRTNGLRWNKIRADCVCRPGGRTVYPNGSEEMMGAESVHRHHLSCARCRLECVFPETVLEASAGPFFFFFVYLCWCAVNVKVHNGNREFVFAEHWQMRKPFRLSGGTTELNEQSCLPSPHEVCLHSFTCLKC